MRIPSDLSIDRLEVSPVYSHGTDIIGYEANCFLPNRSEPIGGGFGTDQKLAKTIAVGETIERFLISRSAKMSDLSEYFEIKNDPTSSGFAFHPDQQQSSLNALCEAFEHSARYHLLASGRLTFHSTVLEKIADTSQLSRRIIQEFNSVSWHELTQKVRLETGYINLKVIICLAYTESGYCWGASSGLASDSMLKHVNHCLIEAWRNKRISLLEPMANDNEQRMRVRRANSANGTICHFITEREVPEIQLNLFRSMYFADAGGYLSRSRMNTPSWSNLPVRGAL